MTSLAIAERTINVPFHGTELFIVNHNGEPYTPMKPIVEGMGLDWKTQRIKIKQRFAKGGVEITLPTAGGPQKMLCLALRKLAAWLNTISPNKVNPEIRDKVIQYQEECDDVLYEYWTKGQVVNPRKPQKTLPGKLAPEQQCAIKELVMSRGKALPKEKQAKAMITMWSALKSHFGCSYKEISEDQFTEALSLAARVPLDGEFIGKQEKPASEPLSANDMSNLTHLVWLMSNGMRFDRSWSNGMWHCLRSVTGRPSPERFCVDDLPLLAAECSRLLKITSAYNTAVYNFEKDVIRLVVRQQKEIEPLIAMMGERMHDMTERCNAGLLALDRLEERGVQKLIARQ